MYFEKNQSYVSRHKWAYEHSGEELLPRALGLHSLYRDMEMKARATVSSLLMQIDVHHESREVMAGRNAIVQNGQFREQCAVWAHEFSRTPGRMFKLTLADVLFFRVFKLDIKNPSVGGGSNRADWKYAYCGKKLINAVKCKTNVLQEEIDKTDQVDKVRNELTRDLVEAILTAEELEQNLDKEYHLSLGDVVYFSMATLLKHGTSK